jgi:hypothetical protein
MSLCRYYNFMALNLRRPKGFNVGPMFEYSPSLEYVFHKKNIYIIVVSKLTFVASTDNLWDKETEENIERRL